MNLSTQTWELCRRFGDEKAMAMLAAAGYDAVDYSLFAMQEVTHPLLDDDDAVSREHALRIRRIVEENGMTVNQTHSPFAFPGKWHDMDAFYGYIAPRIEKSVRIAAILGARCIVVHPLPHCLSVQKGSPEAARKMSIDFLRSLKPAAERNGIRIAVENVWDFDKLRQRPVKNICCSGAEDIISCLEELDDEKIYTACLDVGHCGLVCEEAPDVIRRVGSKRITALHIQDNNYIEDWHTLPGMGKMDWDAVMKALAETGYTGEFTFEADRFLTRYDDEFVGEAATFMAKVGRMLIGKFDRYRAEFVSKKGSGDPN